jgi:transcriptional regulator of acetoin/glycerol metabolism
MGRRVVEKPALDMPERRAEFLSGCDVSVDVRSDVVDSWQRCRAYGVDPDDLDFPIHDVDLDPTLSRAAFPVLDRLSERLSATRTALVLASDVGEISRRWGGDRTVMAELDRVLAVPGACMDERHAGTNGLGTTIELDRAVVISGAEHFAQLFQCFTCVGAPIHHPLTRQPLGVLDLVCRVADTNRLMMPLVLETVEQIERSLVEALSTSERAMLRHYLALRRAGRTEVALVGEKLLLASPTASRLLAGTDPTDLWVRASALAQDRAVETQLSLGNGETVSCLLERLPDDVVGGPAAVIDLASSSAGADRRAGVRPARTRRVPAESVPSRRSMLDALSCRSRAWQQVLHDARRSATFDLPVLVQGEVGTGKLTLLRAMWQSSDRPGALEVVDAALVPIEGPAVMIHQLRETLARPAGLVVLRHVELLDHAAASAVAAVLDHAVLCRPTGADHTGVAVAATATVAGGNGGKDLPRPLADRLAVATIVLPPLRTRPEDVPDVIAQVMATAALTRRWRKEALTLLARGEWLGNVRELANVVLSTCHMRAAGDIGPEDLPTALSSVTRRALTPIEEAEKSAIVAGLRCSGGNKVEAAHQLGLSRSTLYRKLRAYDIEVPGAGAR